MANLSLPILPLVPHQPISITLLFIVHSRSEGTLLAPTVFWIHATCQMFHVWGFRSLNNHNDRSPMALRDWEESYSLKPLRSNRVLTRHLIQLTQQCELVGVHRWLFDWNQGLRTHFWSSDRQSRACFFDCIYSESALNRGWWGYIYWFVRTCDTLARWQPDASKGEDSFLQFWINLHNSMLHPTFWQQGMRSLSLMPSFPSL